MRRVAIAVTALAAATGTVAAGRAIVRHRATRRGAPDRWHSITINCAPEAVGSLPEPIAALGRPVEVRVTPAPADRGTELAVRLADGEAAGHRHLFHRDDDPVPALRRALRDTRQLAETGEILHPDAPPTTEPTLRSRPLEYAIRHAREEGRL